MRGNLGVFAIVLGQVLSSCGTRSEVSLPPLSQNLSGIAGSSAHILLTSVESRLDVEVLSHKGVEPNPVSLAFLEKMLSVTLNKPDGIHIEFKRVVPKMGDDADPISEARALEAVFGTHSTNANTLKVYAVFLDRRSPSVSQKLLAQAIGPRSILMYGKEIAAFSNRHGTRAALESAVLLHEFGHLIGLDHCPNPRCLMHDSLPSETLDSEGFFKSFEIPRWDDRCDSIIRGLRRS